LIIQFFFTFLFKFTFRLELFDQDLKFRIYRSQDSRSWFRCFVEGLSNCLTNLWQKTIGCCCSRLLKLFNNWYVLLMIQLLPNLFLKIRLCGKEHREERNKFQNLFYYLNQVSHQIKKQFLTFFLLVLC